MPPSRETSEVVPPDSLKSRLSVVAIQHYLYEEKVPIPSHLKQILDGLEDTSSGLNSLE